VDDAGWLHGEARVPGDQARGEVPPAPPRPGQSGAARWSWVSIREALRTRQVMTQAYGSLPPDPLNATALTVTSENKPLLEPSLCQRLRRGRARLPAFEPAVRFPHLGWSGRAWGFIQLPRRVAELAI
jgi:hypothetical protein